MDNAPASNMDSNEDLIIDKKRDILIPHEIAKYLTRQQRDGIRFLYEQWKKKRNGVILNDPVFYLNAVQAFLFLNAMKSLTKLRLVLCSKTDLGNVNTLCKFWTNHYLRYVYRERPRFTQDNSYLMMIESTGKWSTTKWDILVVCCPDPDYYHYPVVSGAHAAFKILIVDRDVKAHFGEFTKIYRWINPNDEITLKAYKTAGKNLRETIIFESMLQDTVLRREYDEIPRAYDIAITKNLQNYESHTYFAYFEPYISNKATLSRKRGKNKDATGLKIKRSMKDDKQTEKVIIPQQKYEDLEHFIKNNSPIQMDDIESSDVEDDYLHAGIGDIEMCGDAEVDLRSASPKAAAKDDVTAKQVDNVVVSDMTVKEDCEGGTLHEVSKNIDCNDTDVAETVDNKVKEDRFEAFDTNLKEMEEVAFKKFKGSVLDSIF